MSSSGSLRLPRDERDALATLPIPGWTAGWAGTIQPGKLRRPVLPATAAPRPRLIARIDRDPLLLTLIVAPPGFGKTIVAAQWAQHAPGALWLTADARDGSLPRFWAHLQHALINIGPGFGEVVSAALAVPQRASAADLGRMLADELLDAAAPVLLAIDDFHLVPDGEVQAFLAGLLEMPPAGLRLLITARTDPALPLTRMRLRGTLREIRGDDLLFTDEETRTLAARTWVRAADPLLERQAALLQEETQGWAAGLRLALLADDQGATARASTVERGGGREPMLALLLDETLAGLPPRQRMALVRAALPERFDAHLVATLLDDDDPVTTARAAVKFALASDLCRLSPQHRTEWFAFHPLFRDGLRQRLQRDERPETLAVLHQRAAAWFEAAGLPDAAIGHQLAAGEAETAVELVEREIQPAFAREDWPLVANWLALLPDATIRDRPELMLAQAWLAHLRGQLVQVKTWLAALDEWLDRDGGGEQAAALQAEMALLRMSLLVPIQIDPEGCVAAARRAIATIDPARRYPVGIAWTGLAMGLAAAGEPEEAIETATRWVESSHDVFDGGPVRGFLALLFILTQTGALTRVESVAATMLDLSQQRRLRLAAGWARRFLGDALYTRNDVAGAIAQYAIVARDHDYFHLTGLREVLFGLALSYLAEGRPDDAARAIRRCREIVTGAGSIEQLPVIEAYEAYVALRSGDREQALRWARGNAMAVDCAPLHVLVHPALIRATILSASSQQRDIAAAARGLQQLRERAARAHFTGPLVRIDAQTAVTLLLLGEHDAARAAITRSLAAGAPNGYVRAYLDLFALFPDELRELSHVADFPQPVRAALAQTSQESPSERRRSILQTLTDREREVLSALIERLTYKEIADRLFISPLTVKRHASSIYSKLGATGRLDAIRAAHALGWQG